MSKEKRERPAWPLFLIILLLGICFMLGAGQFAIQLTPSWDLIADVDSNIKPEDQLVLWSNSAPLEPVGSGILTQPAWMGTYLTPGAPGIFIPQIIFGFSTPTPITSTNSTPLPPATPEPGLSATPAQATAVTSSTPVIFIIFPTSTHHVPNTAVPTHAPPIVPTSTVTTTVTATTTQTSTATSTLVTVIDTSTPTGTATVTATATSTSVPPIDTMTPTATAPNPSAPGCSGVPGAVNIGAGDGICRTLLDSGTLLIPSSSFSSFTVDGNTSDYEIVYYEKPSDQPYTFIAMDLVVIEVHVVESDTWYQIFNWGGPVTGQNSSIDGYGPGVDNQSIPKSSLYGSPVQTGVQIDLDSPLIAAGVTFPPTITIDQIRISAPVGGANDGCDIDAIEILP